MAAIKMSLNILLCVFFVTLLEALILAQCYQRRQQQQHDTLHQNNRILNNDTSSPWLLAAAGQRRHQDEATKERAMKFKRQALELAVNRLHILESLDEQLREFAKKRHHQDELNRLPAEHGSRHRHERRRAHRKRGRRRRVGQDERRPATETCVIRLADAFKEETVKEEEEADHYEIIIEDHHDAPEEASSLREEEQEQGQEQRCLANPALKRNIPPYMLNLYHQLVSESQTLAKAVQQMPYQSLVMRSFRQPILRSDASSDADSKTKTAPHAHVPEELVNSGQQRLEESEKGSPEGAALEPRQHLEAAADLVVELSALEQVSGREEEPPDEAWNERDEWSQSESRATSGGACDMKERTKAASERSDLCYWFHLSDHLKRKINGSLTNSRELLVEAELHVFKLLPELKFAANLLSWPSSSNNNKQQRATNDSSRNYHLKTNLLEVSLYQILPRRRSETEGEKMVQQLLSAERIGARLEEFPLRLLDIRRIDLNSSGWETFYVKRAVEDWIADDSLNLGLVIKAKSMFEEPIRIGLIRFADLYDHLGFQFDLSHQPTLVIYTRMAKN